MKSNDYIDESLITTPKPTATSTISKKQPTGKQTSGRKPVPINFNATPVTLEDSTRSLGILKPTEMNLTTYSEVSAHDDITNKLRAERAKAQSIIDRANKTVGLPSRYYQQSIVMQDSTRNYNKDFSTVNESDLLARKSVNSQSFYPANMSTPRTSESTENSAMKRMSMVDNIMAMSEQLQNSDMGITDLCSQFQYRISLGNSQQTSGFESQVFTPAEQMMDELKRDEMSWRQQRDIPTDKNRYYSFSSMANGKPSIGNFFETCGRNDLGDMFKEKSPERPHSPIPLVDSTCTSVSPGKSVRKDDNRTFKEPTILDDSSLLSVSKIQRMLSEVSTNSPGKMIDALLKNDKAFKTATKQPTTEGRRSKSPNVPTKEHDCDEYLEQTKTRNSVSPSQSKTTNSISPNQSKTIYKKSPNPQQTFDIGLEHKFLQVPNHRRSRSSSPQDTRFSQPQARSSAIHHYTSRDSVNSMKSEVNSNLRFSSRVSTVSTSKDAKENLCGTGSSMGSRCPSSLDSIPDGKFPIKSNKVEIVWGCIKVGRNQTQSFVIKNQLSQKVRIQVSVTGTSFQLVKESSESEMLTTMIFVLHPFETKTLWIMFRPNKMGAIAEKLVFHPYSKGEIVKNLKQTIKLFGYGGHVSIDLTKISKDSNGNLWLAMGVLDYKPIIQHFLIKNTGVLSAFALLELENNGLMSKLTSVKINPTEMIIKPQQEIKITLCYTPKKEDFNSRQEIIDIGSFKLVSGAEVVRGRLRRLCNILSQQNDNIDKTILKLSKSLPGEDIPNDLGKLNEGLSSMSDLLNSLTVKQVRLNIEKNPNITLETSRNYFGDSTLFQTLYQDTTIVQDENDINRSNKIYTVDPNRIVFSLPSKKEDTFFFQSKNSTPTQFKITATEGFRVSPSSGTISSDKMMVVTVSCTKMRNAVGKIYVYIKNEMIEVDLKTVLLKN